MRAGQILENLWFQDLIDSYSPKLWDMWVDQGILPSSTEGPFDPEKIIKKLKKAGILPKKDIKIVKMVAKQSTVERLDAVPPPKDGQSEEDYAETVAHSLGANPTLTDVRIYQTLYSGKLNQLKYEIEKGRLVSKDEVEKTAFRVSRTIRDHLLAIPERVAGELASINDPAEVRERLYAELIKALEDLSNESFYPAD